MRTIDLSPLYRSIVGIDRLADLIEAASRNETGTSGYPPFNVEDTGEDTYRIELAVAGFAEDDLLLEVHDDTLLVSGKRTAETGERRFLHRGIAERSFERRFKLADHVVVRGAALENGLLTIDLARELPESKKPRRIEIGSTDASPRLVGGTAA